MKALIEVQAALKAKRGRVNSHIGNHYRSAEDILEAGKPLFLKHGLTITLSDDVVIVGQRFYIKATASATDGKETISVTAFAREEESKKGMDGAQVTGASSSYARKYALGGLLLVDDGDDADSQNKGDGLKPAAKVELPESVAQEIASACSLEAMGKYCAEQKKKNPTWTQALLAAYKNRAEEIKANEAKNGKAKSAA